MKIKTGDYVEITSDFEALRLYAAGPVAGRTGRLESSVPSTTEGLDYYSIRVSGSTWSIREDHFRAVGEAATVVENEDLRWRRAADQAYRRILEAKGNDE